MTTASSRGRPVRLPGLRFRTRRRPVPDRCGRAREGRHDYRRILAFYYPGRPSSASMRRASHWTRARGERVEVFAATPAPKRRNLTRARRPSPSRCREAHGPGVSGRAQPSAPIPHVASIATRRVSPAGSRPPRSAAPFACSRSRAPIERRSRGHARARDAARRHRVECGAVAARHGSARVSRLRSARTRPPAGTCRRRGAAVRARPRARRVAARTQYGRGPGARMGPLRAAARSGGRRRQTTVATRARAIGGSRTGAPYWRSRPPCSRPSAPTIAASTAATHRPRPARPRTTASNASAQRPS